MSDVRSILYDGLLVERHNDHWILTLNRPEKRNALSAELVEAMLHEFEAAEKAGVAVVVFRGEGRNFSAGFDFSDLEVSSEGDLLLRFVRIETLLQAIAYSRCLTVALAHGANFGAGADIIAACKYRVATPGSRFRMPGLKFGLALGTGRLARLVGTEAARDLLITTRSFNAEEAAAYGFIHAQVEQDAWPDLVHEQIHAATSLAPASRSALYDLTLLDPQPQRDMAALALSASAPGLKARIRAFRAA